MCLLTCLLLCLLRVPTIVPTKKRVFLARREKYTKKFFRRKKISDIIKEKGRKAVREATWATRSAISKITAPDIYLPIVSCGHSCEVFCFEPKCHPPYGYVQPCMT